MNDDSKKKVQSPSWRRFSIGRFRKPKPFSVNRPKEEQSNVPRSSLERTPLQYAQRKQELELQRQRLIQPVSQPQKQAPTESLQTPPQEQQRRGVSLPGQTTVKVLRSEKFVNVASKIGLGKPAATISSTLNKATATIGNAAKNIIGKVFGQAVLGTALKAVAFIGKIFSLTNPLGWAITGATIIGLNRIGKAPVIIAGVLTSIPAMFGSAVTAALSTTAITAGAAALIAIIIVPIFMFIINSGAYLVPPSTTTLIGRVPLIEGGTAGLCSGEEDITERLATEVRGGVVNLLPNSLPARTDSNRLCIKPTMLVMHWSAGANDNPEGNARTYETLVRRGLACQLGTDTNDTWFMQPFYETEVEMAHCANSWNVYSISNEMAGVAFTDSPPPPNTSELELSYEVTCKVMEQYSIPWCQIFGHFDVPDSGGKTDPGREFLYNLFVPEIRRRCPTDPTNICG